MEKLKLGDLKWLPKAIQQVSELKSDPYLCVKKNKDILDTTPHTFSKLKLE